MAPEDWVAGALAVALILYVVSGGADFGGGVWDLLATGPRRREQRALIEHAIGPIWEANHVWLILVVVVLFTGFPAAFATVSVALHIPLTLLLVGIVFRGAFFAFRSFDRGPRRPLWGMVFSTASLLGPLLLGVVVGALAAGRITDGDFVSSWLAPFPLAVGALTVALCAFLAAVYLAREAAEPELADDFRRRALLAGGATVVLGIVALILARAGAPRLHDRLLGRVLVVAGPLAALVAVGTAAALGRRRFSLARVLAAGLAAVLVAGWAVAQYPYLVTGRLTVHEAAAGAGTLRLLLIVLALGLPVLVPSLLVLFRVFKGNTAAH